MNTDEIQLARGYPLGGISRLLSTPTAKNKLSDFLVGRYNERYFEPIDLLLCQRRNYGFAIMSLCCLLAETMECYRKGLPTTSAFEWKKRVKTINDSAPAEYKITTPIQNSKAAFIDFFQNNSTWFPNVDGEQFYYNFRNGLLHQAQTQDGWRIVTYGETYDVNHKTLNRTKFAKALRQCFDGFVETLRKLEWEDPIWVMTRRKIWWLIELSR